MYVNKVGPYYNPQETYHYYSLPVCVPQKVREFKYFSYRIVGYSCITRPTLCYTTGGSGLLTLHRSFQIFGSSKVT